MGQLDKVLEDGICFFALSSPGLAATYFLIYEMTFECVVYSPYSQWNRLSRMMEKKVVGERVVVVVHYTHTQTQLSYLIIKTKHFFLLFVLWW